MLIALLTGLGTRTRNLPPNLRLTNLIRGPKLVILKEIKSNEESNNGSKASMYTRHGHVSNDTCHLLCIASRMAETR